MDPGTPGTYENMTSCEHTFDLRTQRCTQCHTNKANVEDPNWCPTPPEAIRLPGDHPWWDLTPPPFSGVGEPA